MCGRTENEDHPVRMFVHSAVAVLEAVFDISRSEFLICDVATE